MRENTTWTFPLNSSRERCCYSPKSPLEVWTDQAQQHQTFRVGFSWSEHELSLHSFGSLQNICGPLITIHTGTKPTDFLYFYCWLRSTWFDDSPQGPRSNHVCFHAVHVSTCVSVLSDSHTLFVALSPKTIRCYWRWKSAKMDAQ